MDINSALQHFTQLVTEFVNHKDFDVEGNKIFKVKQNQLLQFSKTFSSLIVCLIALENSDDANTVYFASQFVKDKLKFQFQQLSPEAIVQTHNKVINIIRTKSFVNKVITNNLALSLSYLYIHCYDKLGTAIDFLKKTFSIGEAGHVPATLYYQYFFRYLWGIAYEANSKRLVIDEMKRIEVLNCLKAQQTEVIMALHASYTQVSNNNKDIKFGISDIESVLNCFTQWLQLQQPANQIMKQIYNHSIFKLAINSLADIQTSQQAAQSLMSAIQAVKNPQQAPNFYEFMHSILPHLLKNISNKIKQQEYDQAQNFIKVLAEFGLNSGKKMIENCDQNSVIFIQSMIKYTDDSLLQVFSDLVDFWQNFIHFIHQRSNQSNLSVSAANQIISKLYSTICNRITYNTTQVHELDQLSEKSLAKHHQSIEDIRERREESRYIFQSIASYLGPNAYICEIINAIKLIDINDSNYWGRLEAHIYSLRDVIKDCPKPTTQLCQLILFFESITSKHIIVIKSVLRVYHSLAAMQQKNEQFILKMLNHVVASFQQPLLCQKAGETFMKICEQNSHVLIKHIASLYQLLVRYPKNDSILIGITEILKRYPAMLNSHLPQIMKNTSERLKSSQSKKEKRNQFNRLFTIIQCIPKGQTQNLGTIVEGLLNQMWPMLQHIMKEPENMEGDQDRLIQRAVKFLKLVMRSIPDQFLKYMKNIFEVVIPAYRKYHINSYVYLFEVTFTVYYKSKQQELINYLMALYQQYCQITYKHLHNEEAIINCQHLVDDFIGLNKRIVTFHTKMFLESGQVKPILEFSILHCLGSTIPRVASSASQLFQIIFMIYWSPYSRQQYQNQNRGEVVSVDPNNAVLYSELKTFILPSVPGLLKRMFKFLQSGPVESARSNILDCFEAVALAFPKQAINLWSEALQQLAQDIMTSSEKERLKQNLLKMGSEVHTQFLNSKLMVGRLLFTISNRYLYRQSRTSNLLNF